MTGIVLRPYQEDALEAVANAEKRHVRKQLLVAATGLGKQAPLDEPVLTPSGWSTMGALRPGDHVIGSDGKPTEVLSIHPQGVKPVVRVTFRDGSWTRCGPEHLWATRSKHDVHRRRPWRIVPATELREGWHVPVVAPVEHPTRDLPIDPYTLGVLLGDGSPSGPYNLQFSTDLWIADRLGWDHHPHRTSTYTVEGRIPAGPLTDGIRALGLLDKRSWEKHVPTEYLTADPTQRLALLRGLLDTDGSPMTDGGVEFSSTSENLVRSVAELTFSLGGIARNITSRVTSYTYNGEQREGRRSWRVNVKLPVCPFLLPRKAERWVAPTKYPPARIIARIEPDGPDVEQVCISVAAADGLYVTRSHIVTHNTTMFVELARRRGDRALILVHRDELVNQAVGRVRAMWPDVDVGIVKAAQDDVHHHVVVASVQTLSRPARLARLTAPIGAGLVPLDPFGLVIVDEAHHAAADSYRKVLSGLDAGGLDGPLLVGVTATPDRGDGRGLDDVFSEIVSNHDLLWGIQAGYLSELRGLAVRADFDLGAVKVRRGDYDAGHAARVMEEAGTPEVIVRSWLQYAADRRTLVFTPTVEMSQHVTDLFRAEGVAAAHVDGTTPVDERRAILDRFETGRLQIVSNCAVLTEGYDNPRVDCIVVARPTKSRALYTQMIGRGSRRHPEKADGLILDVVGASDDLSLVTVPSLFGVDTPARRARLADGTGSVSDVAIEERTEKAKIDRVAAAEVDLFRRVRAEGIAWVRVEDPRAADVTRYLRTLGTDRTGRRRPTVAIARVEPDTSCREWTAVLVHPDRTVETLISDVPLERAQGTAEDWIRTTGGVGNLVRTDAPWRRRRPTPKQLIAARRWRLQVDPSWTAGELSDALDAHIARKNLPRKS